MENTLKSISGAPNNESHPVCDSQTSGAQAQVTQRDYLQLLLAQERRLENLEKENRKLLAERDVLNEKLKAQLQIVARLQSDQTSVKQIRSKADNHSTQLDELPMIDAAEFQPIQEIEQESVLTQSYKVVSGTTSALGSSLGSSMKISATWCGKKVASILT